jgi:hypothetical protein
LKLRLNELETFGVFNSLVTRNYAARSYIRSRVLLRE